MEPIFSVSESENLRKNYSEDLAMETNMFKKNGKITIEKKDFSDYEEDCYDNIKISAAFQTTDINLNQLKNQQTNNFQSNQTAPQMETETTEALTEEEFTQIKNRIETFESKFNQLTDLKQKIIRILDNNQVANDQVLILKKTLKDVNQELEKTDFMIKELISYIKNRISQ